MEAKRDSHDDDGEAKAETKSSLASLPKESSVNDVDVSLLARSKHHNIQPFESSSVIMDQTYSFIEYHPLATDCSANNASNIAQAREEFETILNTQFDEAKQYLLERTHVTDHELQNELHHMKQYYKKTSLERERDWKQQYETLEKDFKDQLAAAKANVVDNTHNIRKQIVDESEARSLAVEARHKAREASLNDVYEKKLQKLEKRLKEVMHVYESKTNTTKESLSETRRELEYAQTLFASRESELHQQIGQRDITIRELQARLHTLEQWRADALTLAVSATEACASASAIPELSSDREQLSKLKSVDRSLYKRVVPVYDFIEEFRHERCCVLASKHKLAEVLRLSKVLLERAETQAVPATVTLTFPEAIDL